MSSDPAAIEVQAKLSKLTDPWERLAAAYQLEGDRQAIDRLVERRPKLAGPVGDLFTQEPNRNWQRALEIYNTAITASTSDADLLSKRAQRHEALAGLGRRRGRLVAGGEWKPGRGQVARRSSAEGLAAGGQVSLAKGSIRKVLKPFTNECSRPSRTTLWWQPSWLNFSTGQAR